MNNRTVKFLILIIFSSNNYNIYYKKKRDKKGKRKKKTDVRYFIKRVLGIEREYINLYLGLRLQTKQSIKDSLFIHLYKIHRETLVVYNTEKERQVLGQS